MTTKEYVSQYLDCKRRLEQLDEQLKTVGESIDSLSINYSGMPHGSEVSSKVETYVITMEEWTERLMKERTALLETMMEIADAIRKIEDNTFSQLLYCRYILGLNWDEVADVIGYDDSYTRGHMHGKALQQIEIPNKIQHDTT